jgi:hypothetical protein
MSSKDWRNVLLPEAFRDLWCQYFLSMYFRSEGPGHVLCLAFSGALRFPLGSERVSGSVEHICRRHVNEARPEPKHVVGHDTSNMDKRVELDQRDGNASVLKVRCTASASRIPGSKQKS